MIDPSQIREILSRMVVVSPIADGVRVSTHVLYPSNSAVSVVVRGGIHEFVVSDDGGAVSEVASSGIRSIISDKMIKARIGASGLHAAKGKIMSPVVPLDGVPAAILLVSNASKEVADWALGHMRFVEPRDFREEVSIMLRKYFKSNLTHDERVLGSSNKPHKFGNVVRLHRGRRLLVDPVVNDSSSINSRLVANLDVKESHDPLIEQMIVFDDSLEWKTSDLKLLEMGAPTIPFSLSEKEIGRRAALISAH